MWIIDSSALLTDSQTEGYPDEVLGALAIGDPGIQRSAYASSPRRHQSP